MKKYTAYHFSRNDDRLGYGDGREIVLGETLSVDGSPKLCEHGLHGSIRLVDALGYASGSHLWVVEIWGKVDVGDDKICGKYRRAVVQYGDVLPLIVEFAYWCADRAAKYAKYAEYAEYAAKSAKYAAKSAAEWAAAKAAVEAAKYAAGAANYAEWAAEWSAKYAKAAVEAARYAAGAAGAAEWAAEYAEAADFAAEERSRQDDWWTNKLRQITECEHGC